MDKVNAVIIVLLVISLFLQVYRQEKRIYRKWYVSCFAIVPNGETAEGRMSFTLSVGIEAPTEEIVGVWQEQIAEAAGIRRDAIIIRCWMPMGDEAIEIEAGQ